MSSGNEQNGGRLSRWSSQKLAHRQAQEKQKDEEALSAAVESGVDEKELEKRHQINREAAEEIDLESLNDSSDFSVFMKDGVPDALKRKAYRILWRTNPVLANVDGLNDYDENFADASMLMKTFQSAWDVTKGYDTGPEEVADVSEAVIEQIPAETVENEATRASEEPLEDSLESEEVGEKDSDDLIAAEQDNMSEIPLAAPEAPEAEMQATRVSLRRRLDLDTDD